MNNNVYRRVVLFLCDEEYFNKVLKVDLRPQKASNNVAGRFNLSLGYLSPSPKPKEKKKIIVASRGVYVCSATEAEKPNPRGRRGKKSELLFIHKRVMGS